MAAEELKLDVIKRRLANDLLSADFQWSVLVAAASSYRHDTVLRPFPQTFLKRSSVSSSSSHDPSHDQASNGSTPRESANGFSSTTENQDYPKLEQAMARISRLSSDPEIVDQSFGCEQLVDLMHWTLNTKNFTLKTCDADKFTEIRQLTGQQVQAPPPNYVFEVAYSQPSDDRFTALRNGRNVLYAYHGSRVENFHSILHFGLQGHMNKNSVFGEGTYLSSELSVSLHYSPTGTGWARSAISDQISCVAVCEIIDDPKGVKCKVHNDPDETPPSPGSAARVGSSAARAGSSRARVNGSLGGDVPEKYYVVRNNDMIRVKYILVYATRTVPQMRRVTWVQRHKFLVIIVSYVLLLIVLALFKSTAFRNYLRRFYDD